MISKSRKLSEIRVDIANTRYKINSTNLVKVLKPIYGKMTIEKKLFIQIKKVQISDNLWAYILCDIIKSRLLFNYL